MYNTRNDRTQSRQKMVNQWFEQFVNNELYEQSDYHNFCKRVKGLTTFQIERIFKQEMRM
jgi:trans-2-enoyl-CoA reductase